MSPFVGTETCQETELKNLLSSLQSQNSYYFLRWRHKVSGFIKQCPDSLSPEGQLFDADKELRWQFQNSQFHLLLLSQVDDLDTNFFPVGNSWETKVVNGMLRENDTRFPNQIKGETINHIAQRYFIDAETGTIQFVALTLKEVHNHG